MLELEQVSLAVRIILGTITVIGILGGFVWTVKKNKYDIEQVNKQSKQDLKNIDSAIGLLKSSKDDHEQRLRTVEQHGAGVAQQLRSLEDHIRDIKDMLNNLIKG